MAGRDSPRLKMTIKNLILFVCGPLSLSLSLSHSHPLSREKKFKYGTLRKIILMRLLNGFNSKSSLDRWKELEEKVFLQIKKFRVSNKNSIWFPIQSNHKMQPFPKFYIILFNSFGLSGNFKYLHYKKESHTISKNTK